MIDVIIDIIIISQHQQAGSAGGELWEQFTRRVTTVNLKKRPLEEEQNGTEVIIG